jgi:hypothetical protein
MRRLAIVLVLVLAASSAFAQAGGTALVSYVEGSATVDGKPASIGDPVPLGATVATAQDSLCEIQWNGKNAVRLGASTTFVFNPSNLQQGSELKQGTLVLVLKKLATVAGAPSFTVRTPSAVAGVRGTSFFINAVDAQTTYICSCNGSVHVEDIRGGSVHDLVSAHHQAFTYTATAAGATVAGAALLYHSDADMEKVAADIGVSIDWTTPDR